MRTLKYALAGHEVAKPLAGQILEISVPETLDEARSLTGSGDSDVVAKFADGFVIAAQAMARRLARAAKDGTVPALDAIQNKLSAYKFTVRAEGTGTRETKPETKQKNVAASAGNKLFERCIADPSFLNRMLKIGAFEQADFDAYVAAKTEAEAAKAATPATSEPATAGATV